MEPTTTQPEPKSIRTVILDAFRELGETFVAFIKAPRALWGINLPFILEGLVYFGLLTILGKFCSENVQLNDLYSGWVYTGVTGGITLAMLVLGGVTDKIGVRRSLVFAFAMMVVGRIMVSLSGTLPLANGMGSPMFFLMSSGLLIMVVAYGLYQPAAYAGVKRYTTPKTAAVGYAVLYSLMNLGAFIFGPISSLTRRHFESVFPPNGLTAVFWVLTGITALSLVLTLVLLTRRVDRNAVQRVRQERNELLQQEGKEALQEDDDEDEKADHSEEKINNWPFFGLALLSLVALAVVVLSATDRVHVSVLAASVITTLAIGLATWEFLRHRPDHPFRDRKLVFFIFILIPVQTLFAHNWLTIPYYLDRAFIGTWVSDHFEVLSNLNPIIIFAITPVIAGLTARANIYRMMIIGTFVMAAPTFLLVAGPHAELFVIYIVLMSIGEAMWQPRFLQWIAEIAPKGKTGAYMGIGQFPWFLTKVVTGLYSGYFIANYVPKTGSGMEMRTEQMWLFYSIIAMISPIALYLAKSWMVSGMRSRATE